MLPDRLAAGGGAAAAARPARHARVGDSGLALASRWPWLEPVVDGAGLGRVCPSTTWGCCSRWGWRSGSPASPQARPRSPRWSATWSSTRGQDDDRGGSGAPSPGQQPSPSTRRVRRILVGSPGTAALAAVPPDQTADLAGLLPRPPVRTDHHLGHGAVLGARCRLGLLHLECGGEASGWPQPTLGDRRPTAGSTGC